MSKTKTLAQLKNDLEQAQRDLESSMRQQLMIQGVILYLNRQIKELTGGV